jgi:four helix bundle protein
MTSEELKHRTRAFALRVVRVVESRPDDRTSRIVGDQLLRSATSVGANYRAACRARSKAEFVAKRGIVEEEADQSLYWMGILSVCGKIPMKRLEPLMNECSELVAILCASIRNTRAAGAPPASTTPKSEVRTPKSR